MRHRQCYKVPEAVFESSGRRALLLQAKGREEGKGIYAAPEGLEIDYIEPIDHTTRVLQALALSSIPASGNEQ